jgi:hypothetical protein
MIDAFVRMNNHLTNTGATRQAGATLALEHGGAPSWELMSFFIFVPIEERRLQ